jgi:hypothetical protein
MRNRIRGQPRRSTWVCPWLLAERRHLFGHYDLLISDLRMKYLAFFLNFLRIPMEMSEELLARFRSKIETPDVEMHLN